MRMRSRPETPACRSADRFGSRTGPALPCLVLAVFAISQEAGAGLSATTESALIASLDSPAFVDTRDLDTCASGSIEGALCMAPSQFLHPNGLPASFRDINWLAGTFGLDPASTAVVFGTDDTDTEFVAGMLYLLGQSRVVIWRGDARSMLDVRDGGTGRLRAILRSRYYASPIRDRHVALDEDVRRFFGAGSVSRVDFETAGEESGWNLRSRASEESLYRRDGDGSLLLLADGTRGAVAGLARLLLERPAASVLVHIDGLRGRDAESLGAPAPGIDRTMLAAIALATALVLCAAFLRRRLAAGRHR